MSRSVELTDAEYERLEQAAAAEGVAPAEWVAGRLPTRSNEPKPCVHARPAETMADLFAGRVGVIDSGGERRSEHQGEVLGEMLDEQRSGDQNGDAGTGNCHVLKVPDPVYTAIAEEAGTRGLTPLGWIVAQLPVRRPPPAPNGAKPRTMAERLAGRIGLFSGSRGLPTSDNVAQSFAEHLEAKQREGRL